MAGSSISKDNSNELFITLLRSFRDDMSMRANQRGVELRAPLLALGLFERVGSNWFLDTLGRYMHTHNEPYRQQLGDAHPLSALSENPISLGSIKASDMSTFEIFWFVQYALGKYSPQTQLIKETNLFFALGNFLEIFDTSKQVILTRHPAGIADSFIKRGLFEKWHYDERFEQINKITSTEKYQKYAYDGNLATKLEKIAYMIVLNSVLIAEATNETRPTIIAYEASDAERAAKLRDISFEIFGDDRIKPVSVSDGKLSPDSTFSTSSLAKTSEDRQTSILDQSEMDSMRDVIERYLDKMVAHTPEDTLRYARSLMFSSGAMTPVGREPSTKSAKTETVVSRIDPMFRPSAVQDIEWRDMLVTNQEFCDFLNALQARQVHNSIDGTYFLYNENMPTERGGRIIVSPDGTYTVEHGYEDHPAYWMTWFGASLFCEYIGARLPLRDEYLSECLAYEVDFESINAEYRVGDVVPVDAGSSHNGIYQFVGNTAIWCADDRKNEFSPYLDQRYFSGIAWNKSASREELVHSRARSVIGNSRGIGIRPARNKGVTERYDIKKAVNLANAYIKKIDETVSRVWRHGTIDI